MTFKFFHSTPNFCQQYATLRTRNSFQPPPIRQKDCQLVSQLQFTSATQFSLRALLVARADNQLRTHDGRSTVDFVQWSPSPVEVFEVLGAFGRRWTEGRREPRGAGRGPRSGAGAVPFWVGEGLEGLGDP